MKISQHCTQCESRYPPVLKPFSPPTAFVDCYRREFPLCTHGYRLMANLFIFANLQKIHIVRGARCRVSVRHIQIIVTGNWGLG